MIVLGQFNSLRIIEQLPMGLTAVDNDETPVFIPYQQEQFAVGETIRAFVYCNQDNVLEGTLTAPNITRDTFASLHVLSMVNAGAFLDWGLKPDLFLPARLMHKHIEEKNPVVVRLIEDTKYNQLIADAKIESYFELLPSSWDNNQPVELLVYAKTPLGCKALFTSQIDKNACQDNTSYHNGMLYHNELPTQLRIGQSVTGYVKHIRADGKVDLTLQQHNKKERTALADLIVEDLQAHGGISSLTDKSSPELIYQRFKTSKGAYKKALGALYKANKIIIQKDVIKLVG
ncbi:MAG: S1-like domain-containing RNA-binding protein [Pseudomonadota bacterium]